MSVTPMRRSATPTSQPTPVRVCLVTELLDEPFDEGMKIFSLNLAKYLHRHVHLSAVTNSPVPPSVVPVLSLPFGRAMFSRHLLSHLRAFKPDILLYVPKASLTPATFLRLVVLNRMAPEARLAAIGLQSREFSAWTKAVAPLLSSLHVFTQSAKAASNTSALGFRTSCLPPGVDISKFHPVDPAVKLRLRAKYGVPAEPFTILHVGHLASSRNLDILATVAQRPDTQVILVASTSTPQDAALKKRLGEAGVVIFDRVLPRIEELYQLSDAYVFPVLDPAGAIEMPLSVFEAMACRIPVLTTPFGDLQDVLPPRSGVIFWRSVDELTRGLDAVRKGSLTIADDARDGVEQFGWNSTFCGLLDRLVETEIDDQFVS